MRQGCVGTNHHFCGQHETVGGSQPVICSLCGTHILVSPLLAHEGARALSPQN